MKLGGGIYLIPIVQGGIYINSGEMRESHHVKEDQVVQKNRICSIISSAWALIGKDVKFSRKLYA